MFKDKEICPLFDMICLLKNNTKCHWCKLYQSFIKLERENMNWMTPEERVEANKKCWDKIRKIKEKIIVSADLERYLFNYDD